LPWFDGEVVGEWSDGVMTNLAPGGKRRQPIPRQTMVSYKQSGQNWAYSIFMVPLLPAWRAHALREGGQNFHLTPVSDPPIP
jgi:hypothetical protein